MERIILDDELNEGKKKFRNKFIFILVTIVRCGSLSEYQCRRLGKKLEEIVTKLCLDRNGIVSVEVNAQGNIVRTIGDTSCLQ